MMYRILMRWYAIGLANGVVLSIVESRVPLWAILLIGLANGLIVAGITTVIGTIHTAAMAYAHRKLCEKSGHIDVHSGDNRPGDSAVRGTHTP